MLNLIKLIIDRAIERILSLVSLDNVRETAIDRIVCTTSTEEIVEGLVKHERVAREFRNLSSSAIANHIDLDELVERLDTSSIAEDIAWHVDAGEVAGNIDLSDLAGEIDLSDLAGEIDYEKLAKHVSVSSLAAESDDALEDRINEAVSQGVANALDAANRRTEPVVEQSPDLVARLLDLAVEKLLARADEAAKNGEV